MGRAARLRALSDSRSAGIVRDTSAVAQTELCRLLHRRWPGIFAKGVATEMRWPRNARYRQAASCAILITALLSHAPIEAYGQEAKKPPPIKPAVTPPR